MSAFQFVSCSDTSCPMNADKQCRAPLITVDDEGLCAIKEKGPFNGKAPSEKHVEILECLCQKCDAWELDEASNIGSCGLRTPLFFEKARDADGELLKCPKCNDYAKQISTFGTK